VLRNEVIFNRILTKKFKRIICLSSHKCYRFIRKDLTSKC